MIRKKIAGDVLERGDLKPQGYCWVVVESKFGRAVGRERLFSGLVDYLWQTDKRPDLAIRWAERTLTVARETEAPMDFLPYVVEI